MSSVEDALVVRMEASLRKFERQMEKGRQAAEKAAVGSERSWQRAGDKITANANRAATGIGRVTSISGRGRFVLQNTANQIGDVAVQMGSGTSASRALGQQLPQLLGGFGALGGVLGLVGPLMGTVAALGIPLAAAFLMAGKEAESLEDKLKGLDQAFSDLKAADKQASLSPTDLMTQYKGVADEAQALFEIDREIAAIRAQGALDSATRGVASELGVEGVFGFDPDEIRNLPEKIKSINDEMAEVYATINGSRDSAQLSAAEDRLKELRSELDSLPKILGVFDDLVSLLGVGSEEAQEIAAQFAAIGQAEGPRAQAEALSELVAYIKEATNNLATAEEGGVALFDALRQATNNALELVRVELVKPITPAADEAGRLKRELAAALALQNRINQQDSKVYSGRGGDPRKVGNDNYTSDLNYTSVEELIEKLTKTTKQGGGAGTGLREAESLFRSTRTAAEDYAREVERINDLHRQFPEIITEEVRDRALDALKESAGGLAGVSKTLEQSMSEMFADIVLGARDASEAVEDLARHIAKIAVNRSITNMMESVDLFGWLFNAKGNVFSGGKVQAFAQGGVVSSTTAFPMQGGVGIMGEAGPEAIMPLARDTSGKLGVRAQSGGTVVNLGVNVENRVAGAEVQVNKGQDGRIDIQIVESMQGAFRSGRMNGVMRQQFGIRPKTMGG
jgi:hypothetical protein